MTITTCVTNAYKEGMIQGSFTFGNTYMVALYTSSAVLNQSTGTYTSIGECTGGNYPAGGVVMPGISFALDTNVVILTFSNPMFTNLTLPDVRGCLIYDVTNGSATVAAFDFGLSIALFTSDFSLIVPAATATTGLIRFN
jgi:hypothetical protein